MNQKIQPQLIDIDEKKLVGMNQTMSVQKNTTYNLFSTFMPRRAEIKNRVKPFIFDLIEYPPSYFQDFNPLNEFKKWALAEVEYFDDIPGEMQKYVLPGGKYAVFTTNGNDNKIFEYIFTIWLPGSDFTLDNRPHFDLLNEHSKPNDKNTEQQIFIPVKPK